ncbi:MAG: hypothetical protein KDC28_14160 [Saprospiraceae bacterium]|nr:hypothetical protein [Saprospiraceae bacterium]MCB9320414.1 hypothetical protein [Lewinellaceae bacterium]
MQESDPFYIGWQDIKPGRFMKNTVWVFSLIGAIVAMGWVMGQQPFANGVFYYGQLRTFEGVLVMKPAPMLKVPNGTGWNSILLVGAGKHGAESTIEELWDILEQPLNGRWVALEGTLIEDDGKQVLELTNGVASFQGWLGHDTTYVAEFRNLGWQKLAGEILDPKCAFGVMKPGCGKTHRSCASLCIAGGIPPVLRMQDARGNINYVLIVDQNGESLHDRITPYLADQLYICGELKQVDDWLVLFTGLGDDVQRVAPWWGDQIVMCH